VIRRRLPAIVIAKPDADRRRGSVIQEVVAHRDDALGGGRFEEPRRNLVDWIGDDSMMRAAVLIGPIGQTGGTRRRTRTPVWANRVMARLQRFMHSRQAWRSKHSEPPTNRLAKKWAGGTGLVPRTWARASDA